MLRRLFAAEPVLIVAVVQAGLALVAAFGLDLSAEQIAALVGFFSAALALVVRQVVTSPATVAGAVEVAATRTATILTSETIGVAGSVTDRGEKIIGGVIDSTLDKVGGLVPSLAGREK